MDPARSRAILIGAGGYGRDELEDLPTVPAGVDELRRLLTDPERGGLEPSSCRVLIDPRSANEVDEQLFGCAREAQDTLLVYYSGHGVPDPYDGALHLAVSVTERDRLHATAIPFEWVRRALRETPASAKIVILDCCFSGRAIQPMSASELAEEADVAGSFVMTASAANRKALAPEGEPFTAFTGALLEVLRDGIADAGELLDLEAIFRRSRASLIRQGRPEPQAQRINGASQLALSKNPAAGSRLELRAVRERALSPDPGERRTIVPLLARIARGSSRHARATQRLLENLRRDPVPEVAEAAQAVQAPRPDWPETPQRARDWFSRDPGWYRAAVLYELDVDSYSDSDYDGRGDLVGLLERLDYLQWLGVNCIVLSPISPPADPLAVAPCYGDADDLMRLIDAVHSRQTRVIYSLQADLINVAPRELERVAITWLERGFDGIRLLEPSGSAVDFATLLEHLSTACRERDGVLIVNTSSSLPPDSPLDSTSCMIARTDFGAIVLLAMRREDASPITDAMRSAHDPDRLQHVLYLRDGRELALDPFPVEEAEYMVQEYAKDPVARLRGGIRRRLAPLVDNGRNELELAYVLLFTLPGSPLLYYGDEIAMGDNLDLDDREALRTPFQWTGQPLGGFSGGDEADLLRPLVSDPVFGAQAVNVESQLRTSFSLLRWVHRFIALRREHPVFGLGTLGLIDTSHPSVLAFTRTWEDSVVLVTANMSRSSKAVGLDLGAWRDRVPVDLLGRVPFPAVDERPYQLTFSGRSFFIFEIMPPGWRETPPLPAPPVQRTPRAGTKKAASSDRGRTRIGPPSLAHLLARERQP